jgi:hypothetical protein
MILFMRDGIAFSVLSPSKLLHLTDTLLCTDSDARRAHNIYPNKGTARLISRANSAGYELLKNAGSVRLIR